MVQDNYYLTDISPVKRGDVFRIGEIFYEVLQLEPLYYKFQNEIYQVRFIKSMI